MIFLLSVLLSVSAQAKTPSKDFSAINCPDANVIAKSYLSLEINGLRISDKCIDRDAYPFLNLLTPPRSAADGVPLTVEVASEANPFTIDHVENLGSLHYKVSFRYHLDEGARVKDIADVMYFDVLEGPLKTRMGCALLAKPPRHLILRKKCSR